MKDAIARLEQRLGFLSMIQQQEEIWEADFLNLETANGSLYQWGLDNGFIHAYNEYDEDGSPTGSRYGELTDLGFELVEKLRGIGADPIIALVQV
tara:strand:+ start:8392 stop:8676 length:285 start_codon:yes stop_codon:yes gene_type:complete